MSVPHWVQDAVFYQIFPDRFANGDLGNDPPNVQPWGSTPTIRGFQGGDLRGMIQHFDYLLDLGINALYLNPIFMASSNHRYNTTDYFQIEPKLGGLKDFHALIETAHRSGVRVILDGVFNHSGRGFFAFYDLLENEADSPYLDWYHVKHFPLHAYTHGHARSYAAWWGIKSLPKFNTDTPAVRDYLFSVARHWIEQGADGWRLDVPNEIDDDSFWAEFRRVVLAANSEAYLMGEIWEAGPRWVGPNHFDGLMNYPLRQALLDYLINQLPPAEFGSQVENLLTLYPPENVNAMYNLLGSHDTERMLTLLGGEVDLLRLAFLFQFTYPGAPAVYYGDEIGLQGGKDPDCRGAFPWSEDDWNQELRAWVKTLIALRHRLPALRRGAFQTVPVSGGTRCYAFTRSLDEERILVILNPESSIIPLKLPAAELNLAEGDVLHNLLGKDEAPVSNGSLQVSIKPRSGMILACP